MSDRVLIVDDDPAMCGLVENGLRTVGFATSSRTSADSALELLGREEFDVVITDIRMGGMSGIELCRQIASSRPDIPVIVITAFGSVESAIEAIRAGAHDFVTKPFDLDTLRLRAQRAAEHRQLHDKVRRLENALQHTKEYEGLLGKSRVMRTVYDLVERVAPSRTPALITGESGTGKELVARAIHNRSGRKGPFVAINCAAVPEALLENELFGHERGAYTDAKTARQGLFLRANSGSLFLDEIGDLPLTLQPKLLRALQERTIRPVGSDSETPFDARIIAATHRDLESAVEDGRFREDLYYRIHVIQVDVPPLRARGNDILLLAQHFIKQFAAVSDKSVDGLLPAVADRLLSYPWPGNVRELQNCVERAVTLARYSELVIDDLPEKLRAYERPKISASSDDPAEFLPMEEVERRHVLRVFKAVGGNKSAAAKTLGYNRKTLYRKLTLYGLMQKGAEADECDDPSLAVED